MRRFKNRSKSSAHKETDNELFNKSITLPYNFAEDLLNLEMELEQDQLCIEDLNKLVELYTNAIEYYESKNDLKYRIFKNKLQSLWMKQCVNNAMDIAHSKQQNKIQKTYQQNISTKSNFSPVKQKNQIELESNLKKKEIDINLKCMNQQTNTDENVKLMIQSHKEKVQKCRKLIQQEIENQKDMIMQRIENRKNKLKNNQKQTTSQNVKQSNENQQMEILQTSNIAINLENNKNLDKKQDSCEKQIRKIFKQKNIFIDKENNSLVDQTQGEMKKKKEKFIFQLLQNQIIQKDLKNASLKSQVNDMFDQFSKEQLQINNDSGFYSNQNQDGNIHHALGQIKNN